MQSPPPNEYLGCEADDVNNSVSLRLVIRSSEASYIYSGRYYFYNDRTAKNHVEMVETSFRFLMFIVISNNIRV